METNTNNTEMSNQQIQKVKRIDVCESKLGNYLRKRALQKEDV